MLQYQTSIRTSLENTLKVTKIYILALTLSIVSLGWTSNVMVLPVRTFAVTYTLKTL